MWSSPHCLAQPEVEAVALELLDGLRPGSAYFDLSTSSPTLARRLHGVFAERGVALLDAPVSGGPAGAQSRKLAIWVGGDPAVFEQHRAVLDAIGDQVIYVGAIGAGCVDQAGAQLRGYTIQAALAEVFSLGVKAGVEPLALWQSVRQGAVGRSGTFDRLLNQFLAGQFDPPAFALRLAHKDMTLATELARESARAHARRRPGARRVDRSHESRLGRPRLTGSHAAPGGARRRGDQSQTPNDVKAAAKTI